MTKSASTARRTAKLINGPADAVTTRVMQALSDLDKGKEYAPSFATEMLRYTSGRCTQFWFAWCQILERAFDKFDWSSPLLVNGEFVKYEGPSDYYRREVEPFLGPIEKLQEVAARYRKGEITHDEGKEQLRKIDLAYAVAVEHPEMSVRQVAAESGVSYRTAQQAKVITKSNSLREKVITIAEESAASGLSEATVARQRRLKADHPDLWAQVEAGEKSTHAAAIEAGIVKVPGVLEQLRKLWAKATDADRRAFMDEVGHGR
jgi:hypothetical protein